MKKYMLLIRGESEWAKLTPDEMKATITRYGEWARRLKAEDRLVDAEPLEHEGRVLCGADGEITDGPFVETKEMIGGFYLFRAESMDVAVAIGRECPALGYGGSVEIRPIADYS